jgi:site-specific recombinase XerD
MIERGANILDVQAILGHVSLKTTSRYLHISSKAIATAPSPLDAIMKQPGKEKGA